MDLELAIKKLNQFKKMSKSLGTCDLVALDENAFVVKVQFDNGTSNTHKPVLGFNTSAND